MAGKRKPVLLLISDLIYSLQAEQALKGSHRVATDALGKKLFYFFPRGPYHASLVRAAIEQEYEIYTVSRAEAGIKLISGYSRSLVFINTDCTIPAVREELTRSIKQYGDRFEAGSSRIIPLVREGATAVPQELLELNEPGIVSKPLRLSGDVKEATERFLGFLEKEEARGQRRYVRFGTNGAALSPLQITVSGKEYGGTLSDISSAGISFFLDGGKILPAGSRIEQFCVESAADICELTGTITLRRKMPDGSILLVALFDAPPQRAKRGLQNFIHTSLQQQFYKRLGG